MEVKGILPADGMTGFDYSLLTKKLLNAIYMEDGYQKEKAMFRFMKYAKINDVLCRGDGKDLSQSIQKVFLPLPPGKDIGEVEIKTISEVDRIGDVLEFSIAFQRRI